MAPPLPQKPVGISLNQAPSPMVVVELFNDVCCPFSKKMYDTVFGAVMPALSDNRQTAPVAFVWQSVPQPWHAQSCCMHEAVMAAALVDPARAAAYIFNLFAHQTDFFDDTTKDLSRTQMYAILAGLGADCGYQTSNLLSLLNLNAVTANAGLGPVTQQLKWAVKYHRTRAVHTTPTVFINGLEASDVSSGWTVDAWLNRLLPLIQNN